MSKRPLFGGAIGNGLEWYDFAVFGFFAPVISTQFFPSDDAIAGLINTFGVFAAGYLVRPIGGLLFGRLGDRFGRKRALQISIVAMAVPTTLIAFLPTHAEVGVLAPALLVALRLAQGLSVGGEFTGSICYLVETAPTGRRGFLGSWAVFSAVGGMLAGSAVAALLHGLLSGDELHQWGWRLPFLGGLIIGLIGWWIRKVLPETPEFTDLVERGAIATHPLRQALREMPMQILQIGGMVLLLGVGIYTLFVWMPTYLTHLVKPPVPHALLINTLAMILLVTIMPVAGACADRFGSKRVLTAASLATAVVVYPLFLWIDTGALVGVIVAQIIFAFLNGAIQGPMPAAMVELFPARVRYSAMAIGYNISLALFGGTAPLVATWLIHASGRLVTPAWYLVVIALVTFAVTMTIKPHAEAVRTQP